jgi:hypothetical protein
MYVLFTADCECVFCMNMDRGSDWGKNEKKKSAVHDSEGDIFHSVLKFRPYWKQLNSKKLNFNL